MFVSVGANSTDYIDTSTVVPHVSGHMVANAGIYKHQRRTVPAAPVRLASELEQEGGGERRRLDALRDPPGSTRSLWLVGVEFQAEESSQIFAVSETLALLLVPGSTSCF